MKTIIKLIKENPDAIYGKGANEVDIVEAEEKLELKFADEYREYLSAFAIAAILLIITILINLITFFLERYFERRN